MKQTDTFGKQLMNILSDNYIKAVSREVTSYNLPYSLRKLPKIAKLRDFLHFLPLQ